MKIAEIPFNQFIGLEYGSTNKGFLVSLPESQQYTNHLGTIHGSALLAVAEAGSVEYLMRAFGEQLGFIPVVRKLEAKFRKPANGRVSARCLANNEEIAGWQQSLQERGRLSISLPMEVVNEQNVVVLSAIVEWFITKA